MRISSDGIRVPGFSSPVPPRGGRTRKQVSCLSHQSAEALRNRQKSGGSSVTERRRWWPHHENALWDIERDYDSRARRGSTQELSDRANPAPQLMAVVMAP